MQRRRGGIKTLLVCLECVLWQAWQPQLAFMSKYAAKFAINGSPNCMVLYIVKVFGSVEFATDRDVLVCALRALKVVCSSSGSGGGGDGAPIARDVFHSGHMEQLVKVVDQFQTDRELVEAALVAVHTLCTKVENNKASFMRHGGGLQLIKALNNHSECHGIITADCAAMRAVTTGDDRRHDLSCAYDNIKQLVDVAAPHHSDQTEAADTADDTADDSSETADEAAEVADTGGYRGSGGSVRIVTAVLLALRQLVANDEAVRALADANDGAGLALVLDALDQLSGLHNASACRAALGVVRNVCGNDKHKSALAHGRGLPLLLKAMELHKDSAPIQEHGIAALAQMCLRAPSNSERAIRHHSAAVLVAAAMRRHANCVPLQRQCCLFIRNVAARCPELRPVLLDEGFEDLLKTAGKHQGAVDEAYAALRDLGCQAQLVTFTADGATRVGIEAFGETKPQFNPTHSERVGLDAVIEENATAPAHSGFKMG
ncbi:armadillo-type protein [Tribonema minus]|uniref:Armadillo-type protein n=1 Tax=Tribonema minus TaxID=303371 RepID=A0A835Z2B7_9STRA|nr:armadillo-type protein [Tribonema minus]